MEQKEMIDLLRQVASGTMDVEQAALKLKEEPFEDLGFAKIDHHRAMRQGVAEVIYGEGKTPEQIFRIAEAMKEKGQKAVLITRMNKESAIYVGERLELQYDEVSRIGFRRSSNKGWRRENSCGNRRDKRYPCCRRGCKNSRDTWK